MIKKFLIFFILLLIIVGGFGIVSALKYRNEQRQQRQTAKAAQTSITLLEGWSNKQIGDYLQKNSVTQSSAFLAAQKAVAPAAYSFLANKPSGADIEGFIFPDTYFIPTNPASGDDINQIILKKALDNFSQKVTPQIVSEGAANGLNEFQLITLASVVEKETGADMTEKKIVAGIFYNRLKAGMPLESDATVSYVTGNAAVSTADTQIDSPYNTYKYKGLPFGPICNPGLDSIIAAANPTATDYFYFLTDPATGRAVYAKTYDEHLANKQKYLK